MERSRGNLERTVLDSIINLKLENEGVNIVSAFDPQVGCRLEENTEF